MTDYSIFFPYITSEVVHHRFSLDKFKKMCVDYDRLKTTSFNKKYSISHIAKTGKFELKANDTKIAEKCISQFCRTILDKYNSNKSHSKEIKNFSSYVNDISEDQLRNLLVKEQHQILPEIISIMKELQNQNNNPKEDLL